jgi:hypothetical protein
MATWLVARWKHCTQVVVLVGLQQKDRRYFHPDTGLVILHTSM